MSFTNKEVRFEDFMQRLHQRIQRGGNSAALIFFECFLKNQLLEELKRGAAADWDGQTVNAGDFDGLYPVAADILHGAATRDASEAHPDIYKEASAVSQAFCDELNELFQCSGDEVFDFIPIKSYTEMMVESGLAKTTFGPDGQTMVALSEKGEEVAREVERELKKTWE